jgi:hypothetical protein
MKFSDFMKPKGSLPFSEKSAIGPYPDPVESNPLLHPPHPV